MGHESFVGFYTSRPFWIGDRPDVDDPIISKNIRNLASEIAFVFDHDGFSLQICRDGMVLVKVKHLDKRASEWDNQLPPNFDDLMFWWSEYLNHINCLYLILDSVVLETHNLGYFNFSEITTKDIFRVTFEDGHWVGMGIPSESYAAGLQTKRYSRDPADAWYSYTGHMVLDGQVFDRVADKFTYVIGHKELIDDLATITQSLSQYKIGHYEVSLTLAWFVIERSINKWWLQVLKAKDLTFSDGSKRINADRLGLLQGRDYPISVILNILELMDEIEFSRFKNINKVRTYRNDIVHQDSSFKCDSNHSQEALNLALDLALRHHNTLDIRLNLALSVTG